MKKEYAMKDFAILGGLLFLLWLLREKSHPLRVTVYNSNGEKVWSSWNDVVYKPKLLYQNTEDHIIEATITNNSNNAISISEKSPSNQVETAIGIPPATIGRILVNIGNSIYGESYAQSDIEILIAFKSELLLQ